MYGEIFSQFFRQLGKKIDFLAEYSPMLAHVNYFKSSWNLSYITHPKIVLVNLSTPENLSPIMTSNNKLHVEGMHLHAVRRKLCIISYWIMTWQWYSMFMVVQCNNEILICSPTWWSLRMIRVKWRGLSRSIEVKEMEV